MAYCAPKLLLVGAAQNLVLLTSAHDVKDQRPCNDQFPIDIDAGFPQEYNTVPTW